jgi:hypothetical protein
MLENSDMNIKSLENEYLKLLTRKTIIEPKYDEIKNILDTINIQTSGLSQVLKAAGVDTEELRRKIEPQRGIENKKEEKSRSLPDEIAKLLGDVKRSLHYRHITDTLIRSGFPVPGQDPYNTVSAYLNRHKNKFAKDKEMGRGYYKLKE